MEHRAMMKRSVSFQSLAAGCENRRHSNESRCDLSLRGSLSLLASSGWFGRGRSESLASAQNNNEHNMKANAEPSASTASPEEQKLRVQEITQNLSIEKDFLSKMRESGVVTSAGYQAVLQGFVSSDRRNSQTDSTTEAPSVKIDRRAEMLKARQTSSRRSSARLGSSRRFSSFFTACAHEDEDFAFGIDVSDTTAASDVRDGRIEILHAGRRQSSRRGSSRRFSSFFTAGDGDDYSDNDFLDCDTSNRAEANIAPLRRKSVQLTQEQIEYIQNAASDFDKTSYQRRKLHSSLSSANSSLSDSIHINNSAVDDEEDVEGEGKCVGGSQPQRRDSNMSLNLEEIFDGNDNSMHQPVTSAPNAESIVKAVQSENNKDGASEQQEKDIDFESSESSYIFHDCAWLPWPERRASITEEKRNETYATIQALHDDNSFLPWPDSPPNNGWAKAA